MAWKWKFIFTYFWVTELNGLNGPELEQTQGDSAGQGNLACCSPWGGRESDRTLWRDSHNSLLAQPHPVWVPEDKPVHIRLASDRVPAGTGIPQGPRPVGNFNLQTSKQLGLSQSSKGFILTLSRIINLLQARLPYKLLTSVQFSSVAQSCPTLCNPMHRSTPGLPVHHQLLEFIQTHVHWVGDAIQPSHPLSSPFPPAPNLSQH